MRYACPAHKTFNLSLHSSGDISPAKRERFRLGHAVKILLNGLLKATRRDRELDGGLSVKAL